MSDAWSCMKELFDGCFDIWTTNMSFGGITFNLLEVAAVSVVIFVIGVILDVLLDGNWGA